ncbi:hypothetical protein [Sulfurovum mangrovi]|uniref:hypothetical protein n=1 Tax=Sulfurovum mangrovi TaxID=2893889 RepID=UPI001E63BC8A|nr:hypothetical protein [Sulfurovum mangrovi]UFH59812.1 hypothetical protein LN246_02965 [Sulfurovum mangrovi]UFH59863.1 hypothetical protein LN246_03225 [Sulfurovum mangrovi]UFH60609.1 hypothetical protein LN246_13610 [Sulfurovum mangrovi]
MTDYVAVIDNGEEVETVGNVEVFLQYIGSGMVELYQTPTKKRSIDTNTNKLIIKRGSSVEFVIKNGNQMGGTVCRAKSIVTWRS